MPEDFIDFKGNVNEIIERFKSENLITVGIKDREVLHKTHIDKTEIINFIKSEMEGL